MVSEKRIFNYTQIGRKRAIDNVIDIINAVGGVSKLNQYKKSGTYTDFVSYVAYKLGASRKLAQEYIRVAMDASRFANIELKGNDVLDSATIV